MTTIAFRAGHLATDSLISYNTYTNGQVNKIAACGDYFVALCGSAFLRIPLEEWVSEGASDRMVPNILKEHQKSFGALLLRKDGVCFEYDNGFLMPITGEYTAIGSGGVMAIGALAHGATAVEAVIAASKHDKCSGGPVNYVKVDALSVPSPACIRTLGPVSAAASTLN